MEVFISGKVQGVFFRAFVRKQALNLAVSGYTRNLEDGRVYVLACGEEDKVMQLFECIQEGPPLAVVKKTEINIKEYEEFEGFQVKY